MEKSSRQRILEQGLRILHENGVSVGLGRVPMRQAAADAYLTTGAAYNIWDGQAAFHRDLAIAAVLWNDGGPLEETLRRVRTAIRAGKPWSEVVRLGAEGHVHDPHRDRGYLISLALRATAGDDEAIRTATVSRHENSVRQFARFVDELLTHYRRGMRPPYGAVDLVTAIGALSEGFGVHALSGIDHPRYAVDGRQWTLFGVSTLALCEYFTEPLEGAESAGAD